MQIASFTDLDQLDMNAPPPQLGVQLSGLLAFQIAAQHNGVTRKTALQQGWVVYRKYLGQVRLHLLRIVALYNFAPEREVKSVHVVIVTSVSCGLAPWG